MKEVLSFFTFTLVFAVLPVLADEGLGTKDRDENIPARPLATLAEDKLPDIDHIEIKGENPQLIYVPIIHDNPEHRNAAEETNKAIEETLIRCQKISEHLYQAYGVRSILLEGIPKSLSDKYNSPEFRERKLSVGDSKSIVYKVWYDLLNKNQWHLVPAYEKKSSGPLTQLGTDYTRRIQKALQSAKENGWFRSSEGFLANKAEFTKSIEEACSGYNERREALLKEDPGLKREYEITVIERNRVFIDNTLAAKGPGIILCGGGHIQDLIDQLEKRKTSYMIVVPKGMSWPPEKNDDETIYQEMLKLGCQLKKCSLTLGDGTAVEVGIPIR